MVTRQFDSFILEGVGKTSIITTIVTDTFPKAVPKLFKSAVTISPDLYLLPNHNNTVLVDSSAQKSAEAQTDLEIEKCHVVILVYDVNNFDITKRLRTYWLPRILKINDKVPIILCGNKIDLRSSQQDELESLLTPNFIEFRQVEMGIECSAKGYIGLIDIISCA
jgi:GTPase SAR1 family protein